MRLLLRLLVAAMLVSGCEDPPDLSTRPEGLWMALERDEVDGSWTLGDLEESGILTEAAATASAWETLSPPDWGAPVDLALAGSAMVVADPMQPAIYIFDGDSLTGSLTGKGEGPEEFIDPHTVAASSDQFWVLDGGMNRWTSWSWKGEQLAISGPLGGLSTELVIQGDSVHDVLRVGDVSDHPIWETVERASPVSEEGACRRVSIQETSIVALDCASGYLFREEEDGTRAERLRLGSATRQASADELASARATIEESIAEVGYTDIDFAAALITREVARYETMQLWHGVECDQRSNRCVLSFGPPSVVSPERGAIVIVDFLEQRFASVQTPGHVIAAAIDDDEVVVLIETAPLGEVGLLRLALTALEGAGEEGQSYN